MDASMVVSNFPLLLTFALALWTVYGICYRLYLSPVARIPGPKLAALTFWYEFYYDVLKQGQYTFKIKELHRKYGPIIRINPYEVHISDPNFYDTVYVGVSTRKTDKWWWSADMFATPSAGIVSIPHALHRRRRAMFSSHFTAPAVHKLESLIRDKITKLLDRLEEAKTSGEPVPLWHAFSALTADIITYYCFPEGYDHLAAPDYAPQLHRIIIRTTFGSHVIKQFPWIMPVLRILPLSLAKKINSDLASLVELQDSFARQVREVIARRADPKDIFDSSGRGQIFNSMLDADVPESEKSIPRLAQEAQILVVAGTVTTAHILMITVYHVLSNPPILSRLMEELLSSAADSAPLHALEKLPYLTAVIYEGLRVGYGIPHRLQRVSPDTTLRYGGYALPPGTPISMSSMLQHDDPTIFPEPNTFRPERWLPIDTEGQRLHRYLVPFSKGTRQCIGMNLASGEMYLTLAGLFSRFGNEMEIWNTVWERDIKTSVDGFISLPTMGSQGLMVTIGTDQ